MAGNSIGGVGRTAQQRPHPFVMNGGAPFRMIDVGDGKLNEVIPHGRGIEHIGVEEALCRRSWMAVAHVMLLG